MMKIIINGVEEDINVQKYIREHKKIDPSAVRKEDRINLLSTACMMGDTELVRGCIDLGVSIDDGWLIENSSYYGHYDIVKILLENGADPYGRGSAIFVSHVRCHEKIHILLKEWVLINRGRKINKILKNE